MNERKEGRILSIIHQGLFIALQFTGEELYCLHRYIVLIAQNYDSRLTCFVITFNQVSSKKRNYN